MQTMRCRSQSEASEKELDAYVAMSLERYQL
jgi:hypothetical protein